jgi:hypothetical protein
MKTVKQAIQETSLKNRFSPEIMLDDQRIIMEGSDNGSGYAVELKGFYSLSELEWLIRDLKQLNATIQTVGA